MSKKQELSAEEIQAKEAFAIELRKTRPDLSEEYVVYIIDELWSITVPLIQRATASLRSEIESLKDWKEQVIPGIQKLQQENERLREGIERIKILPAEEVLKNEARKRVEADFLSPKWKMYMRGFIEGGKYLQSLLTPPDQSQQEPFNPLSHEQSK